MSNVTPIRSAIDLIREACYCGGLGFQNEPGYDGPPGACYACQAIEQVRQMEAERDVLRLQFASWKSAYEKITAGDHAEVRLDTDGAIDEVVGSGVFHVERMDTNRWFFDLAGCRFNIDGRKVTLTPIEVNTWAEEQRRLSPLTPTTKPLE